MELNPNFLGSDKDIYIYWLTVSVIYFKNEASFLFIFFLLESLYL